MQELKSVMVDFQITSKCHLNCKYCFDILKGTSDKATWELLESIDKLYDSGIRAVCVTGGEPAKRDDINEILQYIHNKGMYLYLSTQGNYIKRLSDKTIMMLNCIGLPLDTLNEETNYKLGRPRNQKDIFLSAYNRIHMVNPKCLIKIGTVVNKFNINDLEELGEFIEKSTSGCTWRLYEFNPIGNGEFYKTLLSITTNEFENVVLKLKRIFSNIDIVPMYIKDAENGYFFVGPQMDLLYFAEKEFVKIGDLSNMSPNDVIQALSLTFSDIGEKIAENRRWLN